MINFGARCAPGPRPTGPGMPVPLPWAGTVPVPPDLWCSGQRRSVQASHRVEPPPRERTSLQLPSASSTEKKAFLTPLKHQIWLKIHFFSEFSFDQGTLLAAPYSPLMLCCPGTLQLPPDLLRPTWLRNIFESVSRTQKRVVG